MAGKENREIKNSVFVDLFYEDESAEANEIALFNAIHDEPLPEGTKIRRFRVDNTIYMNFQNDISFDAGGKVIVDVYKRQVSPPGGDTSEPVSQATLRIVKDGEPSLCLLYTSIC